MLFRYSPPNQGLTQQVQRKYQAGKTYEMDEPDDKWLIPIVPALPMSVDVGFAASAQDVSTAIYTAEAVSPTVYTPPLVEAAVEPAKPVAKPVHQDKRRPFMRGK